MTMSVVDHCAREL